MRKQHPQYKGDNSFISRKGTELFLIDPVFVMFDGCTIGDEGRWCLQAIIDITRRTLQTNFIDHTFLRYKWPISNPDKARTRNPAAILEGLRRNYPRTGISWIIAAQHMVPLISKLVDSRISPTLLLMNTGNLSLEFSHCKTAVLSVHMQTWLKLTVGKGCQYIIFQSCGEQSSLNL